MAWCASQLEFAGDGVPTFFEWRHMVVFEYFCASAITTGRISGLDEPFLASGWMPAAVRGVDRVCFGIVDQCAHIAMLRARRATRL